MKRKIIGIFIIALLTISYMPIIGCEATQVPESYESKGGDIKFFFMGRTTDHYVQDKKSSPRLLAYFGIFKDVMCLFVDIYEKNYIFLSDGKIQTLEPPCCLVLLNFTGIGTPQKTLVWHTIHCFLPPFDKYFLILMGGCRTYEVLNYQISQRWI